MTEAELREMLLDAIREIDTVPSHAQSVAEIARELGISSRSTKPKLDALVEAGKAQCGTTRRGGRPLTVYWMTGDE